MSFPGRLRARRFRAVGRRGFSLVEVGVGFAMAAVLLALVGRLVVGVERGARLAEDRGALTEEAENALEALAARPWADLDPGAPPELEPSPRLARRHPGVRLQVAVVESRDPVPHKRVTVTISAPAPSRLGPVVLSDWTFQRPEAAP